MTVSAPARFSLFTFSRWVAAATMVSSGLSWRAVRIASASSASLLVAVTAASASSTRPRRSAPSSLGSSVRTV